MSVFPADVPMHRDSTVDVMDGIRKNSYAGISYNYDEWNGKTKQYWRLLWKKLTPAQHKLVRDFFKTVPSTFYFFDINPRDIYEDETCDETGTGLLDTFTVPGKSISSYTVYVNDVEQTEGAGEDYQIDVGAGTNGEDQVVFEAGSIPADEAVITVDFTGRKRYLVEIDGNFSVAQAYNPDGQLALIEVWE